MSYSNDPTQIRNGMVNFVGAMLNSMKNSDRANKQTVASVMIEEALKLSQNEEGMYDLYVLKPMLRGVMLVFNQRCIELKKLPKTSESLAQIQEYQSVIDTFDKLVKKL